MEESRTPASPVQDPPPAPHLQIQIEQVNVALQQLKQTHERLHDMETRLAGMTAECAGILDRWAKNDERHAAAVIELHGRLSEWNDLERKLLGESATRIRQFEHGLQHEWEALRQKHEAPLQRLDEQATRVAETCLAAIGSAMRGVERAEERLTALEQQFSRELGDLSREVREAIAELRHGARLAPRQPWGLDNVVKLHNELRAEADDTGELAAAGAGSIAGAVAHAIAPATPAAASLPPPTQALATVAPTITDEPVIETASGVPWRWLAAGALAIVAMAAYFSYARVDARLKETAARVAAAEQGVARTREAARRQIAAVERAADRRISDAQAAAQAAQRLTGILAAPDLRRFAVTGRGAARTASGQLLWSRSEGVSLTLSGLPQLPGRKYQLWLVTPAAAVSAGLIEPSTDGRAALSAPTPGDLPRPVTDIRLTPESPGGSPQPTGRSVIVVTLQGASPGGAP